ncbi:MAG TPA: N-acetyltransferase [Vicinamibacterales bacterium]|nr:N-acetyltransferase [Vicinamibacterales bacterium]
MESQIREERAGDEEAIRRVHREAFDGDLEARLVDLLRARGRVVTSLVALAEGNIVGHVLLSRVTIDGHSAIKALGLAPVSVLPQYQRTGIGSRLINDALTICGRDGNEIVVLVGEPKYYRRFGFRPAKPFGLDNEYGANDEFMAFELRPGSLDGIRGLVRYAPEFAEV